MGKAAKFDRAEFTEARKADYRARWIVFLFALLFLTLTYWIARDILYRRLVHGYAQRMYNNLGSVNVAADVQGYFQGDTTGSIAESSGKPNDLMRR